jgi:sulfur-oxidizing protein SoxX
MKAAKKVKLLGYSIAILLAAAGCATMSSDDEASLAALALMKRDFKDHGQATVDRLNQDEMQRICSEYVGERKLPRDVAERAEREQQALIRYPADGNMIGNWKEGEKIAQTGTGKQWSDDPKNPGGGNCYACHQLSKAELSYGTIGPSLYHFGKVHGFTPEMRKYAYSKVYNSQAFVACSSMPRFGHKGILTEQQMKDVVALLMDPDSPVNK